MDPELGRWLSLDPELGSLSMPQSMNRYVYCVNNPLRFVDPTGKFINLGAALLGGAIGAIVNVVAYYVIDVVIKGEEFDLNKLLKEAAIGFVTGAITGLTFGLAHAGTIAKIGAKVIPKVSKALPEVGGVLSKASSIGGKLVAGASKFAGTGTPQKTLMFGARGALAGGVGGSTGSLMRGEDLKVGAFSGAVGGFAGGAIGGNPSVASYANRLLPTVNTGFMGTFLGPNTQGFFGSVTGAEIMSSTIGSGLSRFVEGLW